MCGSDGAALPPWRLEIAALLGFHAYVLTWLSVMGVFLLMLLTLIFSSLGVSFVSKCELL